ncbi:hypothetical protein KIW84_046244 [Lathyrus oleraceus]|uniref:Uncharacterized protein n=1 Tax=Pisum sativum TaxID=3888 RepID=A0A9D4XQE6_PEA|nr:hypothetical protein KIW84_046244 [Pisum sativum]
MKDPATLDVSSLITFSGNPGPPLELCDGDPGILSVTVCSGFLDDITLDSISLTFMATYNADEGIGQLRFRSHGVSKLGPAESDDVMSYEKPAKPILKVSKPIALVDLDAVVSSALLINEHQWVGILVRPLNYSLKAAVLHIDTGPGSEIEETNIVEMESYTGVSENDEDDASNLTAETLKRANDEVLATVVFCSVPCQIYPFANTPLPFKNFQRSPRVLDADSSACIVVSSVLVRNG